LVFIFILHHGCAEKPTFINRFNGIITMHKIDMVKAIAEQTGCLQKDVNVLIDAFIESTKKALKKGDKVTLIGFGTFSVIDTRAKTGRNPQTGQEIKIPASKKIRFSVGKTLKEEIRSCAMGKKASKK
jgi:DNA-binding protein HU-beta